MTPAKGVRPPLLMFAEVRAIAPVAGSPPKKGQTRFAMPWATSSVLLSCRSPLKPSATTAESRDSIAPSRAMAVAEQRHDHAGDDRGEDAQGRRRARRLDAKGQAGDPQRQRQRNQAHRDSRENFIAQANVLARTVGFQKGQASGTEGESGLHFLRQPQNTQNYIFCGLASKTRTASVSSRERVARVSVLECGAARRFAWPASRKKLKRRRTLYGRSRWRGALFRARDTLQSGLRDRTPRR